MKKVVIVGAGGHAREVVDIIDARNQTEASFEFLGYIVDPQFSVPGTIVNDKPVLGGFDWLERHAGEVFVTSGVGAPHQRYQLVQRAKSLGCHFVNLIHPSAILTRWITMGEGVIIAAGCILTNQIRIGSHVHINLDCTISHDAYIQDYVTISPGVHVTGNITLGEGCFLGSGANFVEKVNVGAWSIIGAGCVVTTDIPANVTVVGVPAKVIKHRESGWHLNHP